MSVWVDHDEILALSEAMTSTRGEAEDEPAADRGSLGMIGYLLGGIAAVVMMIGALVVGDHLAGRLSLDGNLPAVTTPARAR